MPRKTPKSSHKDSGEMVALKEKLRSEIKLLEEHATKAKKAIQKIEKEGQKSFGRKILEDPHLWVTIIGTIVSLLVPGHAMTNQREGPQERMLPRQEGPKREEDYSNSKLPGLDNDLQPDELPKNDLSPIQQSLQSKLHFIVRTSPDDHLAQFLKAHSLIEREIAKPGTLTSVQIDEVLEMSKVLRESI